MPEDGITNDEEYKDYRWIESGTEKYGNKKLETLACPDILQFVTGIQVVFGGPHYGALKINLICDVPNWAETRLGRLGYDKPRAEMVGDFEISLTQLGYRERSITKGPQLYCPTGAVVCGLNTKVQKAGWWTDDTGINEVKVMCCPFDDVTLP